MQKRCPDRRLRAVCTAVERVFWRTDWSSGGNQRHNSLWGVAPGGGSAPGCERSLAVGGATADELRRVPDERFIALDGTGTLLIPAVGRLRPQAVLLVEDAECLLPHDAMAELNI